LQVQQASEKAGRRPIEFCDDISSTFRRLLADASTAVMLSIVCFALYTIIKSTACRLPRADISYDDFIRTTEPRHHTAVHALWRYACAA
jgi:methionyl-tRNA synthetase